MAELDLFLPRQQRAIVSALCSSRRADGDLDVDRLVESMAQGDPVRVLPRMPVLTTRAGIELLVDLGAGMVPFRRDAERLVAAAGKVAGGDGLEILYFDGFPLDDPGVGPGPVWTWERYDPVRSARPVVVVTELGLGGRYPAPDRAAERWVRFTRIVRGQGRTVTFLVPYPPDRFATVLRRRAGLVRWDRKTDVRRVLQAVSGATHVAAPAP